jgi:hypothetical protein
MMVYYKTTFIPMWKKEDKDNGYDCVGIVVGEHRWYDTDPYNEHFIHEIKYHQYSELMIGVMLA